MESSRRLAVEKHADRTVIRYLWWPAHVRYPLWIFLVLAVVILVTEHRGHTHSLADRLELLWAAMVLGLVFVSSINWTELRVTRDGIELRCTPVAIYRPRILPRSEIVSVHHWSFLRKGLKHRLSAQLAFPVQLGSFETAEETRRAAEAAAHCLQVECSAGRPKGNLDWVHLGILFRVAACLAAPLLVVLVLHLLQTGT